MPCYRAKSDHTSTMNDKPGAGSNWRTYWEECDCTPSCSSSSTSASPSASSSASPSSSPSASPSASPSSSPSASPSASPSSSSSSSSSPAADPWNYYWAYVCPASALPSSPNDYYQVFTDYNVTTCAWTQAGGGVPMKVRSSNDEGSVSEALQTGTYYNCRVRYKFVKVNGGTTLQALIGGGNVCCALIQAHNNQPAAGITYYEAIYTMGDYYKHAFSDCNSCI